MYKHNNISLFVQIILRRGISLKLKKKLFVRGLKRIVLKYNNEKYNLLYSIYL